MTDIKSNERISGTGTLLVGITIAVKLSQYALLTELEENCNADIGPTPENSNEVYRASVSTLSVLKIVSVADNAEIVNVAVLGLKFSAHKLTSDKSEEKSTLAVTAALPKSAYDNLILPLPSKGTERESVTNWLTSGKIDECVKVNPSFVSTGFISSPASKSNSIGAACSCEQKNKKKSVKTGLLICLPI